MKMTVKYACGHTLRETRFGGKYAEQLEAATRLDCPECYKTHQAQRRQEHMAAQEAELAAWPLATLKGSEKQVQWAREIRAKMLTKIQEVGAQAPAHRQEAVRQVITCLASMEEARYWIDRRDASALALAADLAKEKGWI